MGLFFLFEVPGVFAHVRVVLLQSQLFATRFATKGVVVMSGFFADEENGLSFFLAFCHRNAGVVESRRSGIFQKRPRSMVGDGGFWQPMKSRDFFVRFDQTCPGRHR